MEKHNLFSIISIFAILIWSNQRISGVDAIGIGAIASGGMKIGQFLWDTQQKEVMKNVTLIDIHEQLRQMEIYLETVAIDATYKEKFKDALVNIITLTLKIDGNYNSTSYYLDLDQLDLASNVQEKTSIIDFARAFLSTKPHSPVDEYNTLWIDVKLKLAPALRDLNAILQRKFIHTCSTYKFELESYQQKLVEILELVRIAELKVFLIIKGSAELLRRYDEDQGDRKHTEKLLIDNMQTYSVDIFDLFREIISEASQDVWRCDPLEHKEGSTYAQLNNVFNKYFLNEKNINSYCGNTCSYDNVKENSTCNSYDDKAPCVNIRMCGSRSGRGRLHECKSAFKSTNVGSTISEISFCPSEPAGFKTNRRYDMIKTAVYILGLNEQILGPKKQCDKTMAVEKKISFWNSLTCTVCMCTCDDDMNYFDPEYQAHLAPRPLSDRYFYMGTVASNFEDNFVITGARIVKNKTVVYIEIQEGKLSKEGVIDQSTVAWKGINETETYSPKNLITLKWLERSIELQDINVPEGHVLVGLQLVKSDSRLKLQVHSKPFNFGSGVLDNKSTELVLSTGKPISKGIDLEDFKLPPALTKSSEALTNQYLNFSTSNLMSDLGQTTVPYFDTQNVETNRAKPMGGAGLYYKYKPGYAGYIGLKLKTYDISKHLARSNNNEEPNFTVIPLDEQNIGIFAE